MARNSFNKQMEQYLLDIIRTGEDGNIYRCLVLKTDNQKLKVRDAWSDSTTWRCSDAKVLIEGMNPPYRVLGDSGYPISKCLITPYSTDEAEGLFVFF